MQKFTRAIERTVKLRASDRALPNPEFVLTFQESGVTIRRKGESGNWFLSWRSVIGHAMIHSRK